MIYHGCQRVKNTAYECIDFSQAVKQAGSSPFMEAPREEHAQLHSKFAGLTFASAMMIRVASLAFRRPPEFEVMAPGQPTMIERIDYVLSNDPKFLKAKEEEQLALKNAKGRRRLRSRL